ncbi:hypothetical protein pipiens_006888 [Culex pipiens pipiens]|uniref:RanBP2-type domain-containing protein n=1 Tax=Culex pipiens pipiens TaxID=38569 RepID=A0ABD1DMW5_CULPP
MRRRQWYRRRDPIYQDIVSSLNRRIREECNRANFSKFKDTLRTLHDDRDTLWRITKALRKTTKYSPPLRQGTNIIASSSEKAQLLAASFARAHTNQMPDDPVTAAEVYNSIDFIDRTPLADNHSWLDPPDDIVPLPVQPATSRSIQTPPEPVAVTLPQPVSPLKPLKSDSFWVCLECKAYNARSRRVCLACGNRKSLVSRPIRYKRSWLCRLCARLSLASEVECKHCGAPANAKAFVGGAGEESMFC